MFVRDVQLGRKRMRRLSTIAERRLLENAQAQLDFTLLAPRSLPRGYRITGLDMLDHCRTLVTLFIREGRDWIRLTQRRSDLSLEDELILTAQPYSTLTHKGKSYFIIAGTFMGEPSDGRWHSSRRKIAWQHDGRICELLQIIETSVPFEVALRIAASCREQTPKRM
jgi:hypothetical protein